LKVENKKMKLEITKFAETKFPNVYTYQKNSLANCHAKGLYSIVLKKFEDGKLLRMFYASKEHDLWKNNYKEVGPRTQSLGLAIHSHHCDIQILGIFGRMVNIRCVVDNKKKYKKQHALKTYKYTSSILNGKKNAKFVAVGQENIKIKTVENINKGTAVHMNANELHTVYVEKGQEAAWLILEGIEDENYDSLCYSDDDLTKFQFEEYYKPIDVTKVAQILSKVRLLPEVNTCAEKVHYDEIFCYSSRSYNCMTIAFGKKSETHQKTLKHRIDGPAELYEPSSFLSKFRLPKYYIEGQEFNEKEYWYHPKVIEAKLNKILEI